MENDYEKKIRSFGIINYGDLELEPSFLNIAVTQSVFHGKILAAVIGDDSNISFDTRPGYGSE